MLDPALTQAKLYVSPKEAKVLQGYTATQERELDFKASGSARCLAGRPASPSFY